MSQKEIQMRSNDEIPRRIRLDQNTDVELKIRAALAAVEGLGADMRLTDAVNLLNEAREAVADFVDLAPYRRRAVLVESDGKPDVFDGIEENR
jgi:hypothetical protein